MIAWAILDTGPLVAYLNRDESDNEWAREIFAQQEKPFLTCEPVITEALFLLRRDGVDSFRIFELLDRDVVRIAFSIPEQWAAVRALMTSCADLPMSLADACLVRMAELQPRAEIITLDRHFKMYRMRDRRVLKVHLPPPSAGTSLL